MGPLSKTLLLLPTALLAFLSEVAANPQAPTAIKKQPLDPNEKLLPEHLDFGLLPRLSPLEAAAAVPLWLDEHDGDHLLTPNDTSIIRRHRPAFALHHDESDESLLRRAAEALAILQKRTACPANMNSCSSIGSPNKCCQEGTYCTTVSDEAVGQVACCANGATCGGEVASCPSGVASCAADLGGGCCIAGYVCQGIGCIPSASATPSTTTVVGTTAPQTITTTQTVIEGGSPSTVVVTLTVTQVSSPATQTTTEIVTVTGPGTDATGAPPWRPTALTSSPESTMTATTTAAATVSTSNSDETQTGCPTGFYGCLATHGGGCCRTDRDCQTYSCPAASSTIVSNGVTVVVPAAEVPTSTATSTCANGWFLCGTDAGPVAGCCPSGYQCGTASCFTVEATQTGQVQKEEPAAPPQNLAAGGLRVQGGLVFGGIVGACLVSLMMV